MSKFNPVKEAILKLLKESPAISSKEIHEKLPLSTGYATLKRILNVLVSENYLCLLGRGKSTKYATSSFYDLFAPVDIQDYFKIEIDERQIKKTFNYVLIENVLKSVNLFNEDEWTRLNALHNEYQENIAHLTPAAYAKELERLAIDLSWKSSQIEGNTYTLLETERLLKDKETAAGKSKDDAIMLLNHKEALNFIIGNPDYIIPITIAGIEDIHSLLVKDLGIDRNIRQRRVGISGTNYSPLANEHQIREALKDMCDLINSKSNAFEKALLALVLLSYIQAFNDGNKRTARIVSNAILIANGYCPISFRTVNSIEYKKAMLIFYEQNNMSTFKNIFIDQYEFAVKTYF